jgi:hypothetical protein
MNAPETQPVPPANDMTGAEMVAAALAASKDNPALARTIEALRAECCAKLTEAIDKVAASLAPDSSGKEALAVGKPLNVAALAAASRNEKLASDSRRELAEALVIGALINHGNPDWDPTRPETSCAMGQSAIYALLRSAAEPA